MEMEIRNGKWKLKMKTEKEFPLGTAHGLHILGRLLHDGQRATEFLSQYTPFISWHELLQY